MRSNTLYLIDDDDDLRFTIALSLRDANFEVEEFASADDALARVGEQRPGAILLDYHIEGMSAEEFVRALGALDPEHPEDAPPVVLLTGTHNVADVARQLGVFDWLPKPFDLDELVARANKALAHRR